MYLNCAALCCVCACVYANVCVCKCVCMQMCDECVCVYMCVCVHLCVHLHGHMHVRMHVCDKDHVYNTSNWPTFACMYYNYSKTNQYYSFVTISTHHTIIQAVAGGFSGKV